MVWDCRRAGVSSLDCLVDLVARCHGEAWSRPSLEAALSNPLGRASIAMTSESEAAGFLLARRVVDLVEIDLLGVVPEHRRGGAAAALIDELARVESREGAIEVRLELRESNAAARALYSGLGFVVVGERARYYPDGETALLLTRECSRENSLEG